MKQPQILSCPPVDIPPRYDGIPECIPKIGSTKGKCENCDREVWIGPMQTQFKNEHSDAVVVCVICLIESGLAQQLTIRGLTQQGHDYKGLDTDV